MNEHEMHWIGIDVAKNTFDASIVFSGQHFPETAMRDVPVQTFKRTLEGVDKLLGWVDAEILLKAPRETDVRVIMESTGVYSAELCQWLVQRKVSLTPAIVNPQRTAYFIKSLGLRNKTDRLEARALAFYGAERRPAPYVPLSRENQELQGLNRYRDHLVAERVAMENRGDTASTTKGIRQIAKRRLQQIQKDIKKVEQQMREVIAKNERLAADRKIMESAPGVGTLTACTIMAELGDLRRFERDRQLAAFAGMNPSVRDSGTSVHGRPHLSKSGNARVRQALYLAAMTAIRISGPLQETYQHLVALGKQPMSAMGAVMRKLLLLLRALLKSNSYYDKNYRVCGKPCGKLADIPQN